MKILIVRLSALGDIVHALPVLAAIKKAKPDAQVDWLVEENYASILSIASGLRRRIIVRASRSFETPDAVSFGGLLGYQNAASYLWNQDYDVALDLQGLIKSAVWARISFADRVIGFDAPQPARAAGGVPVFGNGDAANRPAGQQASGPAGDHVIQKNLSILSALQIKPDAVELAARAAGGRRDAGRDRRRREGGAATSSSIRARHGRTSAGRPIASARWQRRFEIAPDSDRS